MGTVETAEVVIIGGGIAGLSLAFHLARAGQGGIVLLEREDQPGTYASGHNAAKDVRLLKRGQDILGRMRDVQVLIDRVRGAQGSAASQSVQSWRDLDLLTASLEDECRRLHARFMRIRSDVSLLADKLCARARRTGAPARRAS